MDQRREALQRGPASDLEEVKKQPQRLCGVQRFIIYTHQKGATANKRSRLCVLLHEKHKVTCVKAPLIKSCRVFIGFFFYINIIFQIFFKPHQVFAAGPFMETLT